MSSTSGFVAFCPWQPGLKLNCTNFLTALTPVPFCCLSSTHVDHPNFCSPCTLGLACGSGSHIERYSPSMHHGSLGGMFGGGGDGGTLCGGRERYLQMFVSNFSDNCWTRLRTQTCEDVNAFYAILIKLRPRPPSCPVSRSRKR